MKAKHTTPRLVKGPKPTNIPKGSNIEKEWAKNVWYVNYSFNGKQQRIKGNLNRIKDYKEKAYQAEVLIQSIKDDLYNGFNPEHPELFIEQLTKETINLSEAVNNFIADCKRHTRKKSVQSYQSKLRYLVETYQNKQLKDITAKDVERYIHSKIHNTTPARLYVNGKSVNRNKVIQWTPATVKAAKRIFTTFFNWCIREGYIKENPVSNIDNKKIRSEVEASDRHVPFSLEDATSIMQYLDENDKFTAFFCRFIYSTCLRPGEIRQLKVKDIDLQKSQIRVPLSAMKNTKKENKDLLDIEPNFLVELNKINLHAYPKEYYITSKDINLIVGKENIGVNYAYNRFRAALTKLNLHEKGYDLYSFKHFGNIQRLNNGWTIAEIMKANRHSSFSMTEIYLKKITQQTDISKKEIPKI